VIENGQSLVLSVRYDARPNPEKAGVRYYARFVDAWNGVDHKDICAARTQRKYLELTFPNLKLD
jgi:hypothetical protein